MKKFILFSFLSFLLCLPAFADNVSPDAVRYYNMGIHLSNTGDYKASLECFEKAVFYSPEFEDAYYNLASTYEFMGQKLYATAVFEKLYKINNTNDEVKYKLAKLYYEEGNYGKSLYYINSISKKSRYARRLNGIKETINNDLNSGKANLLFVKPEDI